MTDFVKLACPSCGGTLNVPDNVDRFACSYCGTEFVAQRDEGVLTISPIVDALKEVQAGVDKTASELAIKRFREDLRELTSTRQRVLSDYERCARAIADREAETRKTREKARKEALRGLIKLVVAILLFVVVANVVGRMHLRLFRAIGLLGGVVLLCWALFSAWKMVSQYVRSKARDRGVPTDLVQERDEARKELTRLEAEIAGKNRELEKHLKIVSS